MSDIYELPEIIAAFTDELEEQLQVLEECILELEQSPDADELIQKIFRVAHTLKGASSTMGFEEMKLLTHEMEDILDKIRSGSLNISSNIIEVLFQCMDYLVLLKEEYKNNRHDIKIDINPIVHKVKNIINGNALIDTINYKKEEIIENYISEDSVNTFQELKLLGYNIYLCKVEISPMSFMKLSRAILIRNYLDENGRVLETYPDLFEVKEEEAIKEVSYLIAFKMDKAPLEAQLLDELIDVDSIKVEEVDVEEGKEEEKVSLEEPSFNELRMTLEDKASSSMGDKKLMQTVRVDVEKLEKMMNLVGELVIEQTRMAQVGRTLHNKYSSDSSVEELQGIASHVSRVVSELQENVMKSRMVPVQQLFSKFPRMVRDLSQELGKNIELVLEGGETEMDRNIIEEISDPLIHLIRNSIDHGIENSIKRKELGKRGKGLLKIKAYHAENHVIITIEDDGSGINVEKVKNKAIERNIITGQEADILPRQQLINLIFESGFSTSDEVSEISGRGVGMDIVRSHINKLSGIIETETEEGRGTKFTIKLPLTLAILRGLLVKLKQITYALPMSNVLEIVRMPFEQVEKVKGQAVIMLRERIIPLVWLHDYFNMERSTVKKNIFVVIIAIADKKVGIVVDELIGNQEIVVKSFGAYIGKVNGFSGATILGDGSVACILDVVGIAKLINER